jgi:uncharacterized OsmC-like protein
MDTTTTAATNNTTTNTTTTTASTTNSTACTTTPDRATHSPTADNGVDVDALLAARQAMGGTPAAAAFQWRATNEWVNGTHSRTTVEKYFGVGAEQSHRTAYGFDTDHPELFASQDRGPTPVETVLAGLAGCLTAGVASVAQHRGIQLRSVTATLEGDMDLRGILGIDPAVRNGFSTIRVHYCIDADATPAELQALVAQSQKRSAVFDVVTNPTHVVVDVSPA